jgi:RNA polymerase sigma-70 factor, ECF subfamily
MSAISLSRSRYGLLSSLSGEGGGRSLAAPPEDMISYGQVRQYHKDDLDHPMSEDGFRPPERPAPEEAATATLSPETTVDLLTRVRAGDEQALDRLVTRCLPALRRWAHGRLPYYVRDIQDTSDLVQDTILAALKRLDRFEPRHEGALQAYLREALNNRIKDLIRKKVRRPAQTDLPEDVAAPDVSPLEQAIGHQNMERYEAALARLRPSDREAIIARLELQYRYENLAIALDKPSANAARVAVSRAIQRLASEMRHAG